MTWLPARCPRTITVLAPLPFDPFIAFTNDPRPISEVPAVTMERRCLLCRHHGGPCEYGD